MVAQLQPLTSRAGYAASAAAVAFAPTARPVIDQGDLPDDEAHCIIGLRRLGELAGPTFTSWTLEWVLAPGNTATLGRLDGQAPEAVVARLWPHTPADVRAAVKRYQRVRR